MKVESRSFRGQTESRDWILCWLRSSWSFEFQLISIWHGFTVKYSTVEIRSSCENFEISHLRNEGIHVKVDLNFQQLKVQIVLYGAEKAIFSFFFVCVLLITLWLNFTSNLLLFRWTSLSTSMSHRLYWLIFTFNAPKW